MPDDEELEIELAPEVLADMEKNPELAAHIRNFIAAIHQANEGVKRGLYRTVDEGIESITGGKVRHIDNPFTEDK